MAKESDGAVSWSEPPSAPAYITFLKLIMALPEPMECSVGLLANQRLYCRPLTACQVGIAYLRAGVDEGGDGIGDVIAAEVMSMSLVDGTGEMVFESGQQILDGLAPSEFLDLSTAFIRAFGAVSPLHITYDKTAWHNYLSGAALHPSTSSTFWTLGSMVEYALGYGIGRTIERPDLFYGKPIVDLTEGQLIAYRCAAEVVAKDRASRDKK